MNLSPSSPTRTNVLPTGGVSSGRSSAASTVIVLTAAIAAFYYGREVLIPVALSILLTFVLEPLVRRLQRLGLSRVPAVLGSVLLAFAAILAFGVIVGNQLVELAENLPAYQTNVADKLRALQASAPNLEMLERGSGILDSLSDEAAAIAAGDRPGSQVPTVRLERPSATPMELFWSIAAPMLAPIASAGIVIVLVIFMLLEREDLRDRLVRLFGGGDLQQSTEAINDAAKRVSRYLVMQLLINATYGIPIGLGLWLIGVPNALLWGLLATVLRFIPYVGPMIAAVFPIALAIAVDPGWSMLLWTLALIVTVELTSNCVLEPRLYGASTGISTVAILLAALFWTALWGPIGLLLSTPLTVCLAVIGRYVPHLRFFDLLLGSEPVLSPPERLYQRMLSGDIDEGQNLAEKALKKTSLTTFYDDTALPALRLAEADRAHKQLPMTLQATVSDSFCRVVSEIADYDSSLISDDEKPSDAPIIWGERAVLCIGGRTGLDLAAAHMLAQLLKRRQIDAQVLPSDAISPEGISSLNLDGVELVAVLFLSASGKTQARQAIRRLRRRHKRSELLIGLWSDQIETDGTDLAESLQADHVARSTLGAFRTIQALASAPIDAEMEAAPLPEHEDIRLAALHDLDMLDSPPEERFDRYTRRLAEVFETPISLVSLIDEDRQFWKSAEGLGECDARRREASRETSICGHVVAGNETLVIEDVLRDKRFANNPWLKERGIRFYAGAPLRADNGVAVGSVCVIDTKPRDFSKKDTAFLQFIADEVMLEMRKAQAGSAQVTH